VSAWIEKEWRSPDGKVRRVGVSKKSRTRDAELRAQGFTVPGYYVGHRAPGSTKKEYRRFDRLDDARAYANGLDRQLQQGTYVPRNVREETLSSFVERMLASSHDIAPSTRAGYRDTWENHGPHLRCVASTAERPVEVPLDKLGVKVLLDRSLWPTRMLGC
jgi:hypothetical protein